jgi:predicted ATPase
MNILATHYLLEARLKRTSVPSFEDYPFCLGALRRLERLSLHPAVTFIVGENGSGKSTLLEAIAVAWGFNPEGGTRNFKFATRASHSCLHEYLTLVKSTRRPRDGFFLRAESFFNVATQIDELDVAHAYGGKSLHEQSHGESFFALMTHRFSGNGLYILDEPEAALSPSRQFAMLSRLHELVEDGSQFIIATHSPILITYPNAQVHQIAEDGLQAVSYEQTALFQETKSFLNGPERYLQHLLA